LIYGLNSSWVGNMALIQHGGNRPGAGRKKGSNRFGESTTRVRLPNSIVPMINKLLDDRVASRSIRSSDVDVLQLAETLSRSSVTLFSSSVPAGFPSPADDHVENQLDLNEHFIRNPAATFCVRATGESMTGAGIFSGDILIVDRSREAVHGSIVIAVVEGELTVKRLYRKDGRLILNPENPAYQPIHIDGEMELTIWGVVSGVTRRL
jgi:DNA polymerase V